MNKYKSYYKKPPTEEDEDNNIYMVMLKALALCFVVSLILIILYALLLSITPMSDASMSAVTQSIAIVSIILSSVYGARKTRKKGWVFGFVLGLIFTLLLIPISMIFGQMFSMDIYVAAKILVGSAVGLIGGIIGVNLN